MFKNVFSTPANTGTTPSFIIEILSSDKTSVTDSITTGIPLKGVTAAILPNTSATVKQVESGVVGTYS